MTFILISKVYFSKKKKKNQRNQQALFTVSQEVGEIKKSVSHFCFNFISSSKDSVAYCVFNVHVKFEVMPSCGVNLFSFSTVHGFNHAFIPAFTADYFPNNLLQH